MTHDLLHRFQARSDLHQSPMYAALMRAIGWQVVGEPGTHFFYRPLGPVSVAKFQRPKTIDLSLLKQLRRAHHTLLTYLEPGLGHLTPLPGLPVEPFTHSCTSLLDLSLPTRKLLASFSQKTRYNITHALKKDELKLVSSPLSQLSLSHQNDFFALRTSWSKQRGEIGHPVSLLEAVLGSFSHHGTIYLAYLGKTPVGALLVLTHDSVATYYAAYSSKDGHATYAPTLLTWQALLGSQQNGCDIFDFGGIYDPRYPKLYKKWPGFTRFKAGFNPTVVSYPPTSLQLFW